MRKRVDENAVLKAGILSVWLRGHVLRSVRLLEFTAHYFFPVSSILHLNATS